jgi:hypothetical protein
MLQVCLFALVQAAGSVTIAVAGQAPPGEYEVKAAFVYNILKFVEWPTSPVDDADRIHLCVVGEVPESAPFDELDGQDVMGKKLTIRHLTTLANVRECHVLFIASSEDGRLSGIMNALKGASTLTVGDTEGFTQRGVVINFYMEQKRVRFDINAQAARHAGLKISSKLLKLAGTVFGAAPGGD